MKFINILFIALIFFIVLNLFYHDWTVTVPVFGLCGWIIIGLMFGMVCEVFFGDID